MLGGGWFAGPLVVALATLGWATEPQPDRMLREDVDVRRLLIDVVAVDADGIPLRGLAAEAFTATIDLRAAEITSVDDLCACSTLSSPGEDAVSPPGSAGSVAGAGQQPPAHAPDRAELPVFVLYVDMSQLAPSDRLQARDELRRFLGAAYPEGARGLAYAHHQGQLVELCSMTTEKARLLAAVEAAFEDPRFADPFPAMQSFRIDQCRRCAEGSLKTCADHPDPESCLKLSCFEECTNAAQAEAGHVRRSLEMLRLLLSALGAVPGRKAVVWLDQRGLLFPSRLYRTASEWDVGDAITAMERAGSAAALARAEIYTPLTTNLGANLSDLSGVRYDDRARPESAACSCIYRVALRPPERADGKLHTIVVRIRGTPITARRRVALMRPADRWHEAAQRALAFSGGSSGGAVATAIVPLQPAGRRWLVAIEVAAVLDGLDWLPTGNGGRASWSVGALLRQDGGRREWVFEEFSAAKVERGLSPRGVLALHRAEVEVPPGRYDLLAYCGDTTAGRAAGVRAEITLADPGKPGMSGPVVRRAGQHHLRLPLSEAKRRQARRVATRRGEGPLPVIGAFAPGDAVEVTTFACGPGPTVPASLRAWLIHSDGTRTPTSPEISSDAPCTRIVDRFEVPEVADGTLSWVYRIEWSPAGDAAPIAAETRIEVAPKRP